MSKLTWKDLTNLIEDSPNNKYWVQDGEFLCRDEAHAECLADFIECLGFADVCTGFYDPDDGVLDSVTGLYYVTL